MPRVARLLAEQATLRFAERTQFADQRAQVRVRRVDPSGLRSESITVSALVGSRASGYPRMASHGDELVFAWTENVKGQSQVKTAVVRASTLGS
jgi:hypothetical protein